MTPILHWTDYIALVIYFALVIGFGVWSSCQNRGSIGGYFLAGRSMHFIPVGASLFASNIGSGHFIGLAGAGSASGIGIAGFELSALFVLMILGWIFVPIYIKAGVYTMPEYIKKRFGGDRIRIYLSVLSLILYIFTKISADLFSGALFIKLSLNLDLYLSIVILLIMSALFTIGGGLSAVIWTDFIQTIIMIIGAFYLMITSLFQVGGYEGMRKQYGYAIPNTTLFSDSMCGLPPKDYADLIRGAESDYPWPGMSLGLLITSIWYWCSDQVIVQRALAAKNLTHVKAGCILAGYLKLLPMFLMVLPGMIARVLYNDEVGCADPESCTKICGSPSGCTNIAYPLLVIRLMPNGARGLMLAVMVAALMSSLTSIFNSSSTIFTMDIWKRVRPYAKDWELMVVGRVFILVLVVISILWIPIIQASQGSHLFNYIQSISSYLAPPICAVYVSAVFFTRINEQGAFWGLMVGLFVGMVRFIWQFSFEEQPCALKHLDKTPAVISKVHYLHFAILLFLITCAVSWSVSLLTKPIPRKHLHRLTYFTMNDIQEPVQIPSGKGFGRGGFCAGANLNASKHERLRGYVNESFEQNPYDELKPQEPEHSHEVIENQPDQKEMGVLKRGFYFICGIETSSESEKVEEISVQETKMDTSIEQDPFWSSVCDINAIIAMAAAGFAYGFFNKYS